jgi:hypothetical protein
MLSCHAFSCSLRVLSAGLRPNDTLPAKTPNPLNKAVSDGLSLFFIPHPNLVVFPSYGIPGRGDHGPKTLRRLSESLAEFSVLERVADQQFRQNQARPDLRVPRDVRQLIQFFLTFVCQLKNAFQKAPLGPDRVLRKIFAHDEHERVGRSQVHAEVISYEHGDLISARL